MGFFPTANERTFLAWMRTSLSTISVGVAITQLFRLDKSVAHDPNVVTWGRPTGMVFIILGIAFLAFAFLRFFHAQVAMMNGYFPASRGIILVTSSATLTALSALFIIILQKS
ncbi:uncharacterized protein BYT42DRAFT_496119 [Radiomyces spectabilis]|uniref:uncharacterized protein n=1 Tax=Radiomyces spectabilis TaxID=64574 RepID=UPI002220F997|nr:uncharacterized protein BYT42DRAFT_496119 [Radiomyces spectabilis]KAI8379427.1 hypothetical protein BYT42DRAFT_496119 [Radiomyces spectabilis]